jgi:uncharacterized secreted protein with C-terminal beta-propeller domain
LNKYIFFHSYKDRKYQKTKEREVKLMDRETLSNYGWIVICILILSVMIALATPFGNFIASAVKNTAAGLFSVTNKALQTVGASMPEQDFEEGYKPPNGTATPKELTTLTAKTWNVSNLDGTYIWTDGTNIYYSKGTSQYVLNGDTWEEKTWKGLTYVSGACIWTNGENIYYSSAATQYVLDKATSTWEEKIWTGLTSFDGDFIWTDGTNSYYSYNDKHYVLNGNTWEKRTWSELPYLDSRYIWTDGTNTYFNSSNSIQYVLQGDTWVEKSWNGLTNFYGRYIWTDGTNIYYSFGTSQYILQGNTWVEKSWNGLTNFYGDYVWTDGTNYYYSKGKSTTQYVFS